MATLRNNCIQSTNPITFELSGVCTSIEELNEIIQGTKQTGISNTQLIEDLYGQLLDLNKLVEFLTKKNASYNLCISPSSNQVVALKPLDNLIKPQTIKKVQKITECKPVLVTKSEMIWRNPLVSISRNEVPILGVGNFRKVGDRLVNQNGKDLIEFLPVHFGKEIVDIVYMGIVDYKWIGDRTTIFEEFMLEYQVYDKKTTVTKVFPAGIFLWKQIADNRISFIN
jgi:hypothetical protein